MKLYYKIKDWPKCGVGNKLLYYWNLRQTARYHSFHCSNDPDVDALIQIPNISVSPVELRKEAELQLALGENFFNDFEDRIPIKEIFKVHSQITKSQLPHSNKKRETHLTIHMRGNDFRYWKSGEGMLSLDYYVDAFDYFRNQEDNKVSIQIITDDTNHPHVKPLFEYISAFVIKSYDDKYRLLPVYSDLSTTSDWYSMYHSTWIISSPSTFAITAGMAGDAKIIHSEKWTRARVNEDDPFWVGLDKGGNDEYKAILV